MATGPPSLVISGPLGAALFQKIVLVMVVVVPAAAEAGAAAEAAEMQVRDAQQVAVPPIERARSERGKPSARQFEIPLVHFQFHGLFCGRRNSLQRINLFHAA